nr:MAG: RNA-dependent RNA polymerase [Totivirus sp. 'monocotyledonae']
MRPLTPWYEQAMGSYDADEITLINVSNKEPLNRRYNVSGFYKATEPLRSDNIPVWCNIRGNSKLTVSSRKLCKYVLAHVSARGVRDVPGYGLNRIAGYCVPSIAIPCEDFWLYYVRVDTPANMIPGVVKRALSAAFSQIDGYDYGDLTCLRYLRREFQVDKGSLITKRVVEPPRPGEFKRAPITAEHHTHFRPEEVWEVASKFKGVKFIMSTLIERLRKVEGISEAGVATFMAYILYARPAIRYLITTSNKIWKSKNVDELTVTLKELSTPLKGLHISGVNDFTQLFELQSLVNRGVGKVNWEKEREHRTHPDVIDVPEERVFLEAMKLFRMGEEHGYVYHNMDIERFALSRWEWSPTGSAHSQHPEDREFIKKDPRHRTKFVTLNMMGREEIYAMFDRPAEMHAWASVKWEWAKLRAIYGVDITGAVITNLAMYRCEEVFKHKFPVGEEAEAGRVHKRLTEMLKGSESYCYDFDDFNAQHSTKSMRAVLIAYYEVFKHRMSDDQQKAMFWVIEAIGNVVIHNNEVNPPEVYNTVGTLLSGWRLTTFMNTALNYIYFKIAGALDSTGVVDSVHNGDDVLLAIQSLRSAVDISDKMSDINARAQAIKCNVFSVGEFLRVEHKIDKDKGLGAQYLTRSCATLVHSRVESQEPLRVIEMVKAMVTRCAEVSTRSEVGAEVSVDMLNKSLERVAEVFKVDGDTVRKISKSHIIVGGALDDSEAMIEESFQELVEFVELGEEDISKEKATIGEMMPGIYDYSLVLQRQFPKHIRTDEARKKIVQATVRQLAVTRDTRLVVKDISRESRYKYGKALFRMYARLVNIPHIEKARFLNIKPIALLDDRGMKMVRRLIDQASDVDYTMRVLL